MYVIGLSGAPNLGKTAFAEALIPALKAKGVRVSAVKHAGDDFDIDHPGRDSHRLRAAGAFETVIASGHRWAKVREFEVPVALDLHLVLTEMADPGDRDLWVVVEGFRHMDQLKIEFWDPAASGWALYPEDPFIVAIVTTQAQSLPEPTGLPIFSPDDAAGVAAFLVANAHRFQYASPYDPAPDVEPPREAG
jgi:molybdopterin-guanine dinucleotide biosynthesis adapter protein